jgi:flagellar assembly protein FliH
MAGIVKDAAVPSASCRRLDGRLLATRDEAQRLLDEAAADARAIVEGARSEAEQLLLAARERAREEAHAETARWLASVAVERERLLSSAEAEVVALALEVARRVVGVAAERHPEIAVESASRALAAARHRAALSLRVHPADAPAVRAAERRLSSEVGRAVVLVEDDAVGRGGAVVSSEAGTVVASLEAQLQALRRALDGAVR